MILTFTDIQFFGILLGVAAVALLVGAAIGNYTAHRDGESS